MSDTPDTIDLAQVLADIETHTEIRYPVVHDPETRQAYAAAQERVAAEQSKLDTARKRQEAAAETAYMTDVPADLDEAPLLEAQADLDTLTDAAKGKRLVAVFRGQMGRDYSEKVSELASRGSNLHAHEVWAAYCELAYKRLETEGGQRVAAETDAVLYGLMTFGDRQAVGRRIIDANENPTSLPF